MFSALRNVKKFRGKHAQQKANQFKQSEEDKGRIWEYAMSTFDEVWLLRKRYE